MSQFGLFLLMLAGILVLIGFIRFLAWLTDFFEAGGIRGAIQKGAERYTTVNHSRDSGNAIMSRTTESDPPSLPAAVRQTEPQTDRPAQWPTLSRDETLDICKVLRYRGFSRDEARSLFRSFHQPLDNNLWTQAAPPEPDYHTPIAGRVTKAQFDDPDLIYRPPN